MVLVDSSVWIEHLRNGDTTLKGLLLNLQVQTHSFVLGELALGSLRGRATILDALSNLPRVLAAQDAEVLQFIENKKLYGVGIGYVDAHLLASVALTAGTALWTLDKKLDTVARRLGLRWDG
jgi:predicted nucleic acid-binding protein